MKSSLIFTSLIVFFLSVSFAQDSFGPNVWLGTANGASADWHHPANWSKGQIPNDLDMVLIPDLSNKGRSAYPVIRYEAEAGSIQLHPLATLTVSEAAILHIVTPVEIETHTIDQLTKLGLIQRETEDDFLLIRNKQKFATFGKRSK